MEFHDDDLSRFAAEGAPPLPPTADSGQIEHDGARITRERARERGLARPGVAYDGDAHRGVGSLVTLAADTRRIAEARR